MFEPWVESNAVDSVACGESQLRIDKLGINVSEAIADISIVDERHFFPHLRQEAAHRENDYATACADIQEPRRLP